MKDSPKSRARQITVICLCALIGVMFFGNVAGIVPHIRPFLAGETPFAAMTEAMAGYYKSDELWKKNDFVNLFGLFMRSSGKKDINRTIVMNNGMLTNVVSKFQGVVKKTDHYTELPKFSEYLANMGSRFIYVAAPCKVDLEGKLLPKGLDNLPNMQTSSLLDELDRASVETLDLRPQMAADVAHIEKYFYSTDHHWTPDGALEAYRIIMERLAEDDPSINASLADPGLWERHFKDDWVLGSHGKRVGVYCAGVDPLIWYTPRFDTSMTCIIPHHKEIFKGDFTKAYIRDKYIERRDLFGYDSNCVYMGGTYPYAKHLNPKAPNDMKLLIIQDSFSLPLQAFLATAFTQVEVIDPRYYKLSGIAEYCMWSKPDIVMMVLNAIGTSTKEYAKLGVDGAPEPHPEGMRAEVLLSDYHVVLPVSDKKYQYEELPVKIEAGTTYRFSFEELSAVGDGALDGVSVVVYDKAHKSVVRQQIFDVDNSVAVGDQQWTFRIDPDEVKNANYKLLVYAGVQGKTKGKGVTYSGISLSKLMT